MQNLALLTMMTAAISTGPNGIETDDESEWEYEYHDTESEVGSYSVALRFCVADISKSSYITLDLSSFVDTSKIPPGSNKIKADAPIAASSSAASATVNDSTPQDINDTNFTSQLDPMLQDEPVTADVRDKGEKENESARNAQRRVQILDFHGTNPIVSYNNQIFSCEWTSTLGTDVLLTNPDPDFEHPVLRELPDVSVLAVTSIKLSGRPIQLTSRQRPTSDKRVFRDMTPASEGSLPANTTPAPILPTRVKLPDGKIPTRSRQNQANFLERLIAIKAAKGEKDEVTVYARKTNQGSGWRSQQRALEEQLADEAAASPDGAAFRARGTSRPGRPRRGAWKARGPRTAKGGLFRDYRPQLWDEEGADIRARPSATPETWDQLESGRPNSRLSFVADSITSSGTSGYQPQRVRSDERKVSFADDIRHTSPELASQSQQAIAMEIQRVNLESPRDSALDTSAARDVGAEVVIMPISSSRPLSESGSLSYEAAGSDVEMQDA